MLLHRRVQVQPQEAVLRPAALPLVVQLRPLVLRHPL